MAQDPIIDSINPMPKRGGESDRESRVRRRAYDLWEAAGRPEGREMDHWLAAEREEPNDNPAASLGTPTVPGEKIAGIRAADPGGLRGDQKDPLRNEAPKAPRTAGAPKPGPDTSKSPVANRDLEGPRKAGTTPRPTSKPIAGA